MNEELETKLQAIGAAVVPLNEMGDEATTTLRDVEERLRLMSAGQEAWVSNEEALTEGDRGLFDALPGVDQGEIPRGIVAVRFWRLGYARINGEFSIVTQRLRISETVGDDDEPLCWYGTCKPIIECPRDIRIAALSQLPTLLDAIKHTLDSRLRSHRVVATFD